MVISNWVERKLEERRVKREEALIEMGRREGIAEGLKKGEEKGLEEGLEEGFMKGRAYERKLISEERNGANGGVAPSDEKD